MARSVLAALAWLALAPRASAQDPFEEALSVIPDLFTGLLGVTLSEEISGASLRIDGPPGTDDTRVSTFRVPWSEDYPREGGRGALHLEAVAGLLLADDFLGIDTASGFATVRQDWTVAGGQIGAGWGFPIGQDWWLRPGATLALAYLENKAHYNDVGAIELAPLIDGILVNWDGWAVSPAANLTLERPRDPFVRDWGFETRYALAWTRVFEATSAVQEGSDWGSTLAARAELGSPIGRARDGGARSSWDVFAGGVKFLDVERDALGFDAFLELGLGWTEDLPRLPALRLELGWIVGEDVRGYSLGVSLGPRASPLRSPGS